MLNLYFSFKYLITNYLQIYFKIKTTYNIVFFFLLIRYFIVFLYIKLYIKHKQIVLFG